jgi:hypothetical protein
VFDSKQDAPNNSAEVVQAILDAGDLLVGIGILNEFLDHCGALNKVLRKTDNA